MGKKVAGTGQKAASTGGRVALLGFLYQILRSIQLGLRAGLQLTPDSLVTGRFELTLEPEDGGDLVAGTSAEASVEQIKIKSNTRGWSSGEVARKVLRDLLKAVRPEGGRKFRFVTDNGTGLDGLNAYLAWRRAGQPADPEPQFMWGRMRQTPAQFESRLAVQAGTQAGDPAFQMLLDGLDIEVVQKSEAVREVDRIIGAVLAPGQSIDGKQKELIGRIAEAASEGRSLPGGELMAMIHPDALRRLELAQSLPHTTRRALTRDVGMLQYDPALEARLEPLKPGAALTILSGESGQGKTWALCQCAMALSEASRVVVVVSGARSLQDVERMLNDRLWSQAYETPASPKVLARKLRGRLQENDGVWLTAFIDDVQDRSLAEALARCDWDEDGVRLVVSAQPRITEAIQALRPTSVVVETENFTSAELRRFLISRGRDASLETMPDDVFELLLKPIHARIYAGLPAQQAWIGVTEYELFKRYWDEAGRSARGQRDHPGDRVGLTALAGDLMGNSPRYPWPVRDALNRGLDNAAMGRLEAVGLLRRVDDDYVGFASDRMLNWAVAEWLCQGVADQTWTPADLDERLARSEALIDASGRRFGSRLGYVFLDVVWLLTREAAPNWIAEFLEVHLARIGHEGRTTPFWSQLGTVGGGLLPALEVLAISTDENQLGRDLRNGLPETLGVISAGGPEETRNSVDRLLAAPTAETLALRAARLVPTPQALDRIWDIHMVRERAFADRLEDHDIGRLITRKELSFEAAKAAVATLPEWLSARLDASTDPFELNHLLWILNDEKCLDDEQAVEIWRARRLRLREILTGDNKAMIRAIQRFGDTDSLDWLAGVSLESDDHTFDRVLASQARLKPKTALQQLREGGRQRSWMASDWWMDELAHADPEGLSLTLRDVSDDGDDPLNDLVLHYLNHPELMDAPTLEKVLDQFEARLAAHNASAKGEARPELGRLGHVMRLLGRLVHPWQFDALARRAGTRLEHELIALAQAGAGRNSRLVDRDGAECARVLAIIDGPGFEAFTVSRLERQSAFAREDGFSAAQWAETAGVRNALLKASDGPEPDTYRDVIRMQALAIHRCDEGLEALQRRGAPIFTNAAQMRGWPGRDTAGLRSRIDDLLTEGEVELAAKMAGFLGNPDDLQILRPYLLGANTAAGARRQIVAVFNAFGIYDPASLPVLREAIEGRFDEAAVFTASYLARLGDEAARLVVLDWMRSAPAASPPPRRAVLIQELLEAPDSRAAALAYLRDLRDAGGVYMDGELTLALAEDGDRRSQTEVLRNAYRRPIGVGPSTPAAIRFLARRDPDEALFAARRYLVQTRSPAAAGLIMQLDPEIGLQLLLQRYQKAPPSERWELARAIRLGAAPDRLADLFADGLKSNQASELARLAELAGWMSPSMPLPWLDGLADSQSTPVRTAALAAIKARRREAAGMAHLEAMAASTKPLKLARLETVFECIDPAFLWSTRDPASLAAFLDQAPPEFEVEARTLHQRRVKAVADAAKAADKRG
jgi:hypothetical protein